MLRIPYTNTTTWNREQQNQIKKLELKIECRSITNLTIEPHQDQIQKNKGGLHRKNNESTY